MSEMSQNGPAATGATEERPGAGMILLLLVSWLWVGVPLTWGVGNTIYKSLPLFQIASTPAAAPTPK
jgi:hypothetical protein